MKKYLMLLVVIVGIAASSVSAQVSSTATVVYGQSDFTSTGSGTGSVNFNQPIGVAVDITGLYVADSFNSRVLHFPAGNTTADQVYGQGGNFNTNLESQSAAGLNIPVAVALDSGGGLYVDDTDVTRVLHFPASNTTPDRVYGQGGDFTAANTGDSSTLIGIPYSVVADAGGGVYVGDETNNRVLHFPAGSTTADRVYGQNGNFNTSGPSAGANGLSDVYGIAVDAGGGLYVTDSGNNRMVHYPAGSTTADRVYGQGGDFNGTNPTLSAGGLHFPWGVAVDNNDGVYVADFGYSRVLHYPAGSTTPDQVLGQNGSFTTAVSGVGATGMSGPGGLAVDSNGGLYVSDLFNNRVLYFPPLASSSTGSRKAPSLQIVALGSIALQVVPNQTLIANGGVSLWATLDGYTWRATTTTPWLTITIANGAFPGMLTVQANAAGLTVGTYNGSVTVKAGAQTITVPVTLAVLPPLTLTASPPAVSILGTYPKGFASGYDIQVGPGGVPFTAQTSAASANWLTATSTASTVHLAVDSSKMLPGTYQDSVVLTSPGSPNSPMSVPVQLTVGGIAAMLPQQVNAATGVGPDRTVAPNEMVSVSVPGFACPAAQGTVRVNGILAAWSEVQPGVIHYSVPANVTEPASVEVACSGVSVWRFISLKVAALIPGIFTPAHAANPQASAINAINSSGLTVFDSTATLYVTGFGQFGDAGSDGLRRLRASVTATVGGNPAAVLYAGEAPGNNDGVQQINLLVPAGTQVGAAVPVTLWVDGTPAQTTVGVQ